MSRLQTQLQAVDLLFEVRDARLPVSSVHPKTAELFGNKQKIIVFAKQDLADPDALKQWIDKLSSGGGQQALALSFKLQKGQDKLVAASLKLTEEKRRAQERKGLLPRPMRACVVGLPNVGKSTLINWLTGRHKAQTGDRPGITRGTQWVRVHPQLELLDTPGILPPVQFSGEIALKLALCNILPQDHFDHMEVAEYGLARVSKQAPEALEVYGNELVENGATLENLARARSCLAAGGKLDMRKAASIFINDFRAGKLGRYVLDTI
ncbi:MAG TPA: ribosome biogenesis GTPase YlqF [Candidatus Obscuribacterales bacterium]